MIHILDTHAVTLPRKPRVFERRLAVRVWNTVILRTRFTVWPADRCPDCDELKEPEMMLCLDCRTND